MEVADKNHTGNYIKEKREKKGLTQKELADILDVAYVTVSNWERGKHAVKPENIEKLAEALGVTPLEIQLGKDYPQLSQEEKEEISKRLMELSEQVGDVQNVTFVIEDRGILSTDTAMTALSVSLIALAFALWAVFAHTTLNLIACWIMGFLGVGFFVFRRFIIKKMEEQLKERKEKN